MKKLITIAVASVFFFTLLIANEAFAQSVPKSNSITDDVLKIAKESRLNCHVTLGNFVVRMDVNLSKWDNYSSEKQAAKANAMCRMISEDNMPPAQFRKNYLSEGIPAKKEIKTICDWAQSLQVTKK